ncbi:MAG TPA: transcriptional regulator [Bacteroidetes bacterium]|nr:transcriptional regulator [Bacteroidota bacterium]
MLSKSCINGLRASILLAQKEQDEFINIQKISSELNVSFYFLTKILQQLTSSGILESYKGPNGGVKLAQNPGEITFRDIVISIDGDHLLKECILGLPGCGIEKPCPMHEKWTALRGNLQRLMEDVTLKDLANGNDLRLSDEISPFKSINLNIRN